MKQNCDLCKVSSTSASPPLIKAGKTKVIDDHDDHHHQQHQHHIKKDIVKSSKYLSSSNGTKHCSSAESPPLKPVATTMAPGSRIRTASGPQEAVTVAQQQLQQQQQQQPTPYHHLHHHQFNGFDEYYSAPLLSPALMMDMMLAAHLLRG